MPFDPSSYVTGIRRQNEREAHEICRRAAAARDEARELAGRVAAADPAVQRVYLFGSLAAGEPCRLDFDIDLAIDGGDVYRAMDVTERSTFQVDVVELRRIAPHIRRQIESGGILLIERR